MPTEFGAARSRLTVADGEVEIHRLRWLAEQGIGDVEGLPYTVKILLEDLLRPSRRGPRPRGPSPSCRVAS